jgi:6-phosphogluconolactonase (cycloisomerase 2 family)
MPLQGRPSQVTFTPNGEAIFVTLRGTNTIESWAVGEAGSLSDHSVIHSIRPSPFGMAFARNDVLVVSEPSDQLPIGSSASSYEIGPGRSAIPISEAVANGELASCWLTLSPDRSRAYVSNTGSGTLSTYGVSNDGELTVRQARVLVPMGTHEGTAPIDAGISRDGDWLFQLLGATGDIAMFRTDSNGGLVPFRVFHAELPTFGSQGLVVNR